MTVAQVDPTHITAAKAAIAAIALCVWSIPAYAQSPETCVAYMEADAAYQEADNAAEEQFDKMNENIGGPLGKMYDENAATRKRLNRERIDLPIDLDKAAIRKAGEARIDAEWKASADRLRAAKAAYEMAIKPYWAALAAARQRNASNRQMAYARAYRGPTSKNEKVMARLIAADRRRCKDAFE